MPENSNRDELLLFVLLLALTPDLDDPYFDELIYRRIRDRLRRNESPDPEWDHVLMRLVQGPWRRRRREWYRDIAESVALDHDQRVLGELSARFEQQGDYSMVNRIRIEALEEKLTALQEHANAHDRLLETTRGDLYEYLITLALGTGSDVMPLHRYFPVRVYVREGGQQALARVVAAVEALLDELDLEVANEFPARHGSWFKEIWAKTREKLSQQEVREKLGELGEKTQHALELREIGMRQAEINQSNAAAVKTLVEAMGAGDGAAQIGSVLVLKTTCHGRPVVQARTLTTREMVYLERNQHLLSSPGEILQHLSKCNRADELAAGADDDLDDHTPHRIPRGDL